MDSIRTNKRIYESYNFTNNTPAPTLQNNEVYNSNNEPIQQRNNEAKLKSLIEDTEEASTKRFQILKWIFLVVRISLYNTD